MTNQDFTDTQRSVLAKAEKLMRLAAKTNHPDEAASATAKAMELLSQYNLDVAALELGGAETGKRAEENLLGGFYEFERQLWKDIAELNFCWCWFQVRYLRTEEERKARRGRYHTNEIRLIGRTVNIAATKAMASYLLQAIERETRAECEPGKIHLKSRWAVSYRKGMAERVRDKVYAKRREMLKEEETAAETARKAQVKAGLEGVSTSTAVTLSSVKRTEEEGNYDFVYGEGKYREKQERQRVAAEERQREMDAYTAWAAANPEEAAEKAKKEREERDAYWRKRQGGRRSYADPVDKTDRSAYAAGFAKAADLGIDPQTSGGAARKAIR